jgi:hypothetical protein
MARDLYNGTRGIGDGVVVGDRPSTGRLDLGDHLIGHRRAGAGAVPGAAEVIDHDAGALFGEGHGVFAAQSAACTGDDDDSVLHSWHGGPLSGCCG